MNESPRVYPSGHSFVQQAPIPVEVMGLLLEGVHGHLDRGSLKPGLPHPSFPLHAASSRHKEPPDAPEPPVLWALW